MRIIVLALCVVFATASNGLPVEKTDQPVEATRKNIKALQGLPESQLFLAMNFISDSLGVRCDYCHVKSGQKWLWESDEKPQKATGLTMIRMVLAINKEHFEGSRKLTCYSCHRGSLQVATLAPLPPHDVVKERAAIVARPLPPPAEVVARYLAAIGGDAAAKVQTVVMKAAAERAAGPANVEIVMKGPEKLLVTLTTSEGVVKQGLTGDSGWRLAKDVVKPFSPAEIAQIRAVAVIYDVIKVTDDSSRMRNPRFEKAGDRDAYAVDVNVDADTTRTYFFDLQTGLLLRRRVTTRTMIAPLSEQADFDDYRDVAGVKLPFLIRRSDVAPYDTSTSTFSEIRTNAAIDDAVFNAPQSGGASRQ